MTRICSKCGESKDRAEFYVREARCRACVKAHVQAWRVANRDKHRAQSARYKAKNRDRTRVVGLARYYRLMEEDPERVRAWRRDAARTPKGALYNRLAAHRRRGVSYDAEAREYAAIILNDPCVYCGGPAVEVDHITPVARGGTGHWSNLAAACRTCNASKNDRSLLSMIGA